MSASYLHHTPALLLAAILLAGILFSYALGKRVYRFMKTKNPEHESGGLVPLEGALLGLLSLLLAFTFNKSASNYYTQRDLIVDETNNIGTALFRADLYPDSVRHAFRSDFKEYLAARIEYYDAGTDEGKTETALQKATLVSDRIWKRAADAADKAGDVKSMQMIPAVNNMMDSVSKREESRNAHIPGTILLLLFLLCFAGSFIVGYAGKSKKTDWVVLFSYSFMTVLTIYIILDLDRPRRGILKSNKTHESMQGLFDTIENGDRK